MTRVHHPCRKETSGPFEWCVHEACRPEGRIPQELERMDEEKTPTRADALPAYKASIRFGPQSGPNLDWESPYEISVTGPAAFVAHVVTSAADAFEEDAQR